MEPTYRILIVDDDREIRELTASYLRKQLLHVSVAADGREMRRILEAGKVDLVILDVLLPNEDGFALCRQLHSAQDCPIPVIMLSACCDDVDRIVGLETGADDYLTKPFVPRELLARIKAILRRYRMMPENAPRQTSRRYIEFGDWRLDVVERSLVAKDGAVSALASAEYNLLRFFLEHSNMVISRDQVMNHLRGIDSAFNDRSVDLRVSRLRKALHDDARDPVCIKTLRNEGYMLCRR